MAATFTNRPANSNRDLIRILVHDTDTANAKLSDETIDYYLSSEPSVWYAAALAAETIAGQYSAQGTLTVGDLSIQRQVSEYRGLSKQLRMRGARGAVPFAGGIKISDKDTEEDDTDRVAPSFKIGLHDDKGSTY